MSHKRIIPKSQWPKALRHPIVKGVCVGCRWDVEWEDEFAHAHFGHGFHGWICFERAYYLLPKFRNLQLHELAHLLAPITSNHDRAWRNVLTKLGGSFKKVNVYHRGWIYTQMSREPKPRKRP